MFFKNKLMSGIVAASALAITAIGAPVNAADDYPNKPIRMLVGFPAGGTTDVSARIIAKEIGDALGETVIVENRPGAGSNIASDATARSKPDGYTIYMVAVTAAINQTLYKNLRFNLIDDFTPISAGVAIPNVLVVNPDVPANSVQELVDYAKANPGKLNFASSGSGTSIHMAGELFKQFADVDVQHIPYKGSAPAVADLLGGQVDYMFDNMPSAWPHVQAGGLRALAVTTTERSEAAPDLPTMMESGFDTFNVSSWFGVIGPKGIPEDIVNKLNKAIQDGLAKPEVKENLAALGAVPVQSTPEEFGAFIKSEVEGWASVVEASGARVD